MNAKKYLNSKEAKAVLKVQDCHLAHIRNAGKLKFEKKGNAFMYSKESIEEFKTKNK
jgi:hypothetical protein